MWFVVTIVYGDDRPDFSPGGFSTIEEASQWADEWRAGPDFDPTAEVRIEDKTPPPAPPIGPDPNADPGASG